MVAAQFLLEFEVIRNVCLQKTPSHQIGIRENISTRCNLGRPRRKSFGLSPESQRLPKLVIVGLKIVQFVLKLILASIPK